MKRAFALLLVIWAANASAHKASTSYLQLRLSGSEVSGRRDIALRDLDYALALDTDGDTLLTWGEVRRQQSRIADYALRRLTVRSDQDDCRVSVGRLQIADHSDGRYASLALVGQCPHEPVSLSLSYQLLFDVDALPRGLLNLDFRGSHSALFAPEERVLRYNAARASSLTLFTQYFRAGVWHVWTGWDHMLFLGGLFLPAIVRRRGNEWQPATSLRGAHRHRYHGHRVHAGARVDALARGDGTVLAADALDRIGGRGERDVPGAQQSRADGLPGAVLARGRLRAHSRRHHCRRADRARPASRRSCWSLLAFNLGVEAAQLSVLLAVIPVSFICRRSQWYRWLVLIPGALFITVVGLLWLIQRAFNVDLGIASS